MSTSPPPRSRSSLSKANIGAAPILADPFLLQNPKLIHIANQLANWKCWKALQDGQIQVVHRRKSPIYIPRADIVDDPESPTVEAIFEVPGLRSDEIHVTVRDGHLIVHGERGPSYKTPSSEPLQEPPSHPAEQLPRAAAVRELRYGPFQRRVKLPVNIKESDIVAKLSEGMLKVTWPRTSDSNDSDTCVKSELSSPSMSMRTSPEPLQGQITADTAQ